MTPPRPMTNHEHMTHDLLRYLKTWQAPSGALHGVHTHPVWRIHPGVLEDHFTGYSAWGAPTLLGLADLAALARQSLPARMLADWITFVLGTQRPDGWWRHCGAELGTRFDNSHVDNFLQDVSLCYAASRAPEALPVGIRERIGAQVRRNLEAFLAKAASPTRAGHLLVGTVNQDCAGIWAMLEWNRAFGEDRAWRELALEALRAHRAHHLVPGLPDEGSAGMLRGSELVNYVEPAEYYGVIIPAYLEAFRCDGAEEFLDTSVRLARHVIRSTWRDDRGCLRLHRTFDRVHGRWLHSPSPMLVSGAGLLLRAIHRLVELGALPEGRSFLDEMDRTLGFYRNGFGFFVQATEWHDDFDLICGTAWQGHDLAYLALRAPLAGTTAPAGHAVDLGIILGWHDCWVENETQWAIMRPWTYGFGYAGNKSEEFARVSAPAWCNPKQPAVDFAPSVHIRKVAGDFVIRAPGYRNVSVTSIYGKKWVRED